MKDILPKDLRVTGPERNQDLPNSVDSVYVVLVSNPDS